MSSSHQRRRSRCSLLLAAFKRDNPVNRIRKGFTLIELLIVVVIIGILSAIAIPKFSNTKKKAYTAAMKSDLRNLVTAEESFFSDSGRYKAYVDAGGTLGDTVLKFRPSSGVSTPNITPGQGYWSATVTHTQIPAPFSCGIGVGTTNTVVTTASDGAPACQ
jgi:prepilin-type N-terminal cleavage/methylation domain-containing protein